MAWKASSHVETFSARVVLPRIVYPFGAPQTVSTETPLRTFVELGDLYADLWITLRNHDLVNSVMLYVDQSESGVAADEDRDAMSIGPDRERRIEFRDVAALWWSISAAGDPGAGNPSCLVSWQVTGRVRCPGR